MYYNLSFDIAAILILSVIVVGMKTVLYTDTRGHKLVRGYAFAVMISAVIDIITAYTICYGYLVPDPVNLILNTIYQYSSAVCVAFVMQIVFNYYPSSSRRSILINRIIWYLLVGMITLNMFTGLMFRFENGVYVHGPLYPTAYVLSLSVEFHMLVVALKNSNDRSKVVTRIIILFLFLPSIFAVIQMIVKDILLVAFGEAFSIFVILFALETPDYRKLMKTMKELEIAREEANVANRSKSDFLAGMSHEIRTPINGILGMNTMILRDCRDPQILEYAENIRVAGNGLLSIINDILDLSKIESGRMELHPAEYEIFSVMNDCFQINRMRAGEKSLEFTVENDPDMPAEYYGDEVRIRQIMNNLISNGIKYTKEGSVKLRLGFEEIPESETNEEGRQVELVISVTDTGIGIKEEDQESLFIRFARLDEGKNKNIEGTGLGLPITQQLVTMMNGMIKVSSEYGKGSVFTVKIPQKVIGDKTLGDFSAKLKEHANVVKTTERSFKAPGKRALVVDDTKINIMVLKGLLRSTEMTVDSAMSGPEGIEMTKKTKYDIIFMDHKMPGMDGIEAFHRIRDDGDNINHDTPVIVLTANAIVGARESYLEEGFAEYLTKPVEHKELFTVTEKLLEED